jgi:hypothetical protein
MLRLMRRESHGDDARVPVLATVEPSSLRTGGDDQTVERETFGAR